MSGISNQAKAQATGVNRLPSKFQKTTTASLQRGSGKVGRIESKLIRYDASGNMTCIVCSQSIKKASLWSIHLRSAVHKTNLASLQQKKNPQTTKVQQVNDNLPSDFFGDGNKNAPPQVTSSSITNGGGSPIKDQSSRLPSDFFTYSSSEDSDVVEGESNGKDDKHDTDLPEGFFDDKNVDAAQRNTTVGQEMDKELELFENELENITKDSNAIVENDEAQSRLFKINQEIRAQQKGIDKMSSIRDRYESMKKKRKVGSLVKEEPIKQEKVGSSSSSNSDDDDDMLDWRAKNIYKSK